MLDSYLHIHSGDKSQVDLQKYYEGLHLINIHSVNFYNNFINISAKLGNTLFYYTTIDFITIPEGSYSLQTFNKYLSSLTVINQSAINTQIRANYNGIGFSVCNYSNTSDRNADVN